MNEVATLLAETLGAAGDLHPEPVTAVDVEAAYLRRMKATGAEIGPPEPAVGLPQGIGGRPAAT